MSEETKQKFIEVSNKATILYQARHIHTKVEQARGISAGHRWPFELIQNALDPGPRADRPSININFRHSQSNVVFEHDGMPFTLDDLSALISGGSSKEYESASTTGRFGTGFLVTHVLAKHTELQGLVSIDDGCEQFNIVLDRSGNEKDIVDNICSCQDAIGAARRVSELDGLITASFHYSIVDDTTLIQGFNSVRNSLPYLYITRNILGRVELDIEEDGIEVWKPGEVICHQFADGYVEYRTLQVERNGSALPEIRVFRFMIEEDSSSSALVIVEKVKEGWKVRLPELNAPRVYREYPLRGSVFVPINFVLNGKFDPDEERNRVKMIDKDKKLLIEAFAATVIGVKYAFEQKWEDAHLLATACKPTTGFELGDAEETNWWAMQLRVFADKIARLPIVDCNSQFLPAISEETFAYFVIPRLSLNLGGDETTVERLWPLIEAATDMFPPSKEIALDWTIISEGWYSLGLEVNLITVSRLAEYVRKDAETLDQLRVYGDRKDWLAKFLDIVGECWRNRQGVDLSAIVGMLPNQNNHLCLAKDLYQDSGVSDRLKDICSEMGIDVRKRLLLEYFNEIATNGGLEFLEEVIVTAIPEIISENGVIEEAIKLLEAKLPEEKDCGQETVDLQKASVRLLHYLSETRREGCGAIAKKMPLITSNQRAVIWGPKRMMMAPVCTWHESAQPFANAYPPDRILNELYAGSEAGGIPSCVQALVDWGVAFADPITVDEPMDLKGPRLKAISFGDAEGIVVKSEQFSQIAFLPDVLLRCQEGVEEAHALLGLVLCHVAPHDGAWQEDCIVVGRKSGEEVSVPMRSSAIWLADLKFRAWVPIEGEDGKTAKAFADETTLKGLLDPAWLENNDSAITLLRDWFNFDELDLRLFGIAPDEDKRQEIRNGLAKLLEYGGADTDFYTKLAEDVERSRRRERDFGRFRRLGIAVQEAIKVAMEAYSLKLKLVDRGFDYEVTIDGVLEDAGIIFEVGPYLLEVKATTVGEVRLTPMQAQTASKEPARYVLCVADLRGLSEEELGEEWSVGMVESLAKVIPDIGDEVANTCFWIEGAKTNPVTIRNESALRYGVPVSVWEAGVSISEWVAKISECHVESVTE